MKKDEFDELVDASFLLLEDGCPNDPKFQLCRMQPDYYDGACAVCWRNYLQWLADRRPGRPDPYRFDRARDDI